MSLYEKIALVVIVVALLFMTVFSFHEIKEPPEHLSGPMPKQALEVQKPGSHFDASQGQEFKIGTFVNIISKNGTGGTEESCESLKPVIIAALHDIKEHLEQNEAPDFFDGMKDTFEVNEQIVQLFCTKFAEVTLADATGNQLLLVKTPFVRTTPPGGDSADIGTKIQIDATVILLGKTAPKTPTTSGVVLIPDRYLDSATSSSR